MCNQMQPNVHKTSTIPTFKRKDFKINLKAAMLFLNNNNLTWLKQFKTLPKAIS